MASRYVWDPKARRYRDTRTGRFLARSVVMAAREDYIAGRSQRFADFLDTTLGGLDPDDLPRWRTAVARVRGLGWRRMENTLIAEYVFGRGGKHAMTLADRVVLRELLLGQRQFWNRWMAELVDSPASIARIRARADLYTRAARGFFERGRAEAWGIRLPAHPADGSTQCRSNCTCTWDIRRRKGRVEATWRLGSGEHCDDCLRHAAEWAPLIFDTEEV